MKRKIFITLFAASIILTAVMCGDSANGSVPTRNSIPKNENTGSSTKLSAARILQARASSLKAYLQKGGYNEEICFFIDMGASPGKKRFFAYSIKTGVILNSGLVAHGSGGGSSFEEPHFSNSVGSNCTSLGKYKIGQSYSGQFGLAYKLHGLDKTNNNAFARFVVLHAHDCVPEGEIYPESICMSWGCPTVAPAFLKELAKHIDASDKPILLEIYNGR